MRCSRSASSLTTFRDSSTSPSLFRTTVWWWALPISVPAQFQAMVPPVARRTSYIRTTPPAWSYSAIPAGPQLLISGRVVVRPRAGPEGRRPRCGATNTVTGGGAAGRPRGAVGVLLARVRLLQGRDVQLGHLVHRLGRPGRLLGVRVADQVDEPARDDLPGQAELSLDPTAGPRLAAVLAE